MKNSIKIIILSLLVIISYAVNAQRQLGFLKKWNETYSDFYDLTLFLPKGYVIDGSQDYTEYLQRGIDKYRKVLLPNFPVMVNENGLIVKNDTKIVFREQSVLKMKPTTKETYAIMKLFNVSNVEIVNPVLIGELDKHLGKKGEWGFGIWCINAKNIKVISPIISNFWGDGIVIGTGSKNAFNQNITISDAKIFDCRRNGITIASGINIFINNPIIYNIKGTSPMAGIDIEAHNSDVELQNIIINNPTTKINGNYGILIALGPLASEKIKTVKIEINNHVDICSRIAFGLGSFRGKELNLKKKLNGTVKLNNSKWYDNKESIGMDIGIYDLGPLTVFKNIQIFKSKSINDTTKEKLPLKKDKYKSYGNIIFE